MDSKIFLVDIRVPIELRILVKKNTSIILKTRFLYHPLKDLRSSLNDANSDAKGGLKYASTNPAKKPTASTGDSIPIHVVRKVTTMVTG